MDLITQALTFKGCLTVRSTQDIAALVSTAVALEPEDVKWRLLTRAPVHLVSIQDGNLVPLQDGLNNYVQFIEQISKQKTNFVTEFVSYIRLGGLEAIMKETGKLKVVALMGLQSSGKSYMLNRLFGTRFDVAAHRYTDGIWMSVSRKEKTKLYSA